MSRLAPVGQVNPKPPKPSRSKKSKDSSNKGPSTPRSLNAISSPPLRANGRKAKQLDDKSSSPQKSSSSSSRHTVSLSARGPSHGMGLSRVNGRGKSSNEDDWKTRFAAKLRGEMEKELQAVMELMDQREKEVQTQLKRLTEENADLREAMDALFEQHDETEDSLREAIEVNTKHIADNKAQFKSFVSKMAAHKKSHSAKKTKRRSSTSASNDPDNNHDSASSSSSSQRPTKKSVTASLVSSGQLRTPRVTKSHAGNGKPKITSSSSSSATTTAAPKVAKKKKQPSKQKQKEEASSASKKPAAKSAMPPSNSHLLERRRSSVKQAAMLFKAKIKHGNTGKLEVKAETKPAAEAKKNQATNALISIGARHAKNPGYLMSFTANDMTPVKVNKFERTIAFINSGHDHTGLITVDGALYMYGANDDHQLGTENTEARGPESAFLAMAGVQQVACGAHHTLCLKTDGKVFSWGSGLMGILGHESDADCEKPTQLTTIPNLGKLRKDGQGAMETALAVSCGPFNSAVICQDHTQQGDKQTVYVWGANQAGQMGNGDRQPSIVPVAVSFKQNLAKLAFGDRHSLALTTEGHVLTWGSNQFGQLGRTLPEGETDALRPGVVDMLVKYKQTVDDIQAGVNHVTVKTTDGALFSWGSGETHQIGVFDNIDQFSPVPVPGLPRIEYLSVGQTASAAVSESGDVYFWGHGVDSPVPKLGEELRGEYIQFCSLGSNDIYNVVTGSTRQFFKWDFEKENGFESAVQLQGKRMDTLDLGATHGAGLSSAGRVVVFGENHDYQLGTGNDSMYVIPAVLPLKTVMAHVCCGYVHTAAISAEGQLYVWGSGALGKLGHGHDADVTTPEVVKAFADQKVTFVTCSQYNTAALTSDNSLYVWGSGQYGQMARPNHATLPASLPCKVSLPAVADAKQQFVSVAMGDRHVCAVTSQGDLYCWGDNEFGQLGMNLEANRDEQGHYVPIPPTLNAYMSKSKVASAYCGELLSIFLTQEGQLFAAGNAETQQLGQELYEDQFLPVIVPRLQNEVIVSVKVGPLNCAAIAQDGRCFVWGFSFQFEPVPLNELPVEDGATRTQLPDKISLVAIGMNELVVAS